MGQKKRAFSLIELMVVITIIAILVAVAIPLYNTYTARSRLSSGLATIDGMRTKVLAYYSAKGVFPTEVDLGLPSGYTYNPSISGFYLSPYIYVYMLSGNLGSGNQCQYDRSVVYFGNYDNTGDYTNPANTSAKLIIMSYAYIDVKGTILNKCSYTEYDAATMDIQADRGLIPSCEYNNPNLLQNTIDTACQ